MCNMPNLNRSCEITYRTYGADATNRMAAIDILLLRSKGTCFECWASYPFNLGKHPSKNTYVC